PALALLIAERLPWQPGAERGARSAGRLRAPHFTLRALCRYGVLASSLLPLAWSVYRVLEPWNRADCAGAAKYVMSCLQPGDGVAGNHWEYAYYFRRLGAGFSLLGETRPALQRRLWLVTTAGTLADRLTVVRQFGREGWQALEKHAFMRTSVFLLSKL